MAKIRITLTLLLAMALAGCGASHSPAPFPSDSAGNSCGCDDADTFCSASCCPMNCSSAMVASIDSAQSSVRLAANTPLSPPITQALARAQHRGVAVQMVLPESQTALLPAMKRDGIKTKIANATLVENTLLVDDAAPEALTLSGRNKPAKNIFARATPRQKINDRWKWQTLWDNAKEPGAP